MQYNFYHAIYAILIAFLVNIILSPFIIPFLTKLKFGQNVREDGPETHLIKAGTPTMGGIIILISIIISSLFFLKQNYDGFIVLFVTIAYGIVGFLDDYIKVARKRSLGLTPLQKIVLQLIICIIFLVYIYRFSNISTSIYIPFFGGKTIELGILYIPFVIITMLATVNGVNLTDGLDGLASGVTALVVTFFLFISLSINNNLLPIAGAGVGSLIGFLLFNTYPAKIFMGDTGSLALGGFVASLAIIIRMPIFIIIVGIIYVLETVSVVLQVVYFKLTKGKRLFKMAPLHHHFEQIGYKEVKVVTLFYIITAIFCLIGFLGTKNLF